VGTASGHI